MGIRVGYEPVSSIGALGLEAGRNAYAKWLAQMRQQQAEMQQRAQLQAQQIAANKEHFSLQSKFAMDERNRAQQERSHEAEADRLWRASEAQKQRDWLTQQKQDEIARANTAASDELAGIKAAFGDNPLAPKMASPEQNKQFNDAIQSTLGPFGTVTKPGQAQIEDEETTAFKRQYTPSQRRELDNIYISRDRIERDNNLSEQQKAYALKELLKRRDQILRSPVPVLPEKSPIRVENIDGIGKVIIDQNGGIHEASKFDPEIKRKQKEEEQRIKEEQAKEKKYQDAFLKYSTMKGTNDQLLYTPQKAHAMAQEFANRKSTDVLKRTLEPVEQVSGEWNPPEAMAFDPRSAIGNSQVDPASGSKPAQSSPPVRVSSPDDVMRLVPVGGYFITPDGQVRRRTK